MPPVTLTYTFATEHEAAAFLSREPVPAPGKPAKTDKPAASTPSASPTPAAAAAPAPAPTPATPAPSPAPTPTPAADPAADYLKSGLPELIQQLVAKDRPGAVALLTKLGVKKGAELKPAQFADAKAAFEAALAPADDLA